MTPRCLRPASGYDLLHRPSQSWTRLATGRLHAVRETVLDVRLRARTRPRLHLDGMRGVDGCCLVTARPCSARRWLFFPPVRSRESLAVPFLSLLLPLRPSLTTSPMARTYTIYISPDLRGRRATVSTRRSHGRLRVSLPQTEPTLFPRCSWVHFSPTAPLSSQTPHPPPKTIPTLPPFSSPISTSNHLKSLSGHPNFSLPLYHSLSQALAFSQLDELTN